MTREQLDSSFEQTWAFMEKVAKRKCRLPEDAMDMVQGCYVWVAGNHFYESVPHQYAYRKWKQWLLTYMSRTLQQQHARKAAEKVFESTEGNDGFAVEALTSLESEQVVEDYLEGQATKEQRYRKRQMVKALLPPEEAAH